MDIFKCTLALGTLNVANGQQTWNNVNHDLWRHITSPGVKGIVFYLLIYPNQRRIT